VLTSKKKSFISNVVRRGWDGIIGVIVGDGAVVFPGWAWSDEGSQFIVLEALISEDDAKDHAEEHGEWRVVDEEVVGEDDLHVIFGSWICGFSWVNWLDQFGKDDQAPYGVHDEEDHTQPEGSAYGFDLGLWFCLYFCHDHALWMG
jgi:hypothetical protein